MIYDWLQHIEFANVWVLPFLGMLPVFIFLYYRSQAARKSTIRVSTAHAFKVKTFKNAFVHLPFWLRLLALGCLILALARPQVRDVRNRTKGEGIDMVLCIDVSGSMRSRDFY